MIEEAEKRPQEDWSREMELFMMSDLVQVLFWLPNGMALRALTDYWHEMQARFGYQEVQTPLDLLFPVDFWSLGSPQREYATTTVD